MTTTALDTSAAHPLYLYVVFVVCVVAALALLVGASLSRRNSSWRRQMQAPTAASRPPVAAYPIEPDTAEAELVTAPAKKPAARKTATATKKAPAAKKPAAKKTTTAKKTATRARQ